MRILLLASPTNTERAKGCWTSFVESTELPIECNYFEVAELSVSPLEPRAWAQARWSDECPDTETPETGRIFMFDGFFSSDHEDHQRAMVLLHETVHLRLLRNVLQSNYQAIQKLEGELPTFNAEHDADEISARRATVAGALASCVQEIACDKFLCAKYPALRTDYLRQRSWYYCEPNAYLGFKSDDKTATLEPYLTIYRLTRAEAGCSLCPEDADLVRLRAKYDKDLEQQALDAAVLAELRALKQEIVSVRVDRDERDRADYMGLCARALAHWWG